MKYLRVKWVHGLEDEPVDLYSEIDEDGYEVRKVEVYRDGRHDYADEQTSSGTTMLAEKAMPSVQEIASQVEFLPELIDAEAFEHVWRHAISS